jgi:primosomal protein N' (replication factor Y) (superfamily II helicase)
MTQMYADIILPFPLDTPFTYSIPASLVQSVVPGTRVEVSFRNKVYTGVVVAIHDKAPATYKVKSILSVPDEYPLVDSSQLNLWKWMADYYLCTMGEVFNAAVPAFFKLGSETIITEKPDSTVNDQDLDDKEFLIKEALSLQHELSVQDIRQILGQNTVQPILKRLLTKGVIAIREEIKGGYKPRVVKQLKLGSLYREEEALQAVFETLNKAVKQQHALMVYYQLAPDFQPVNKAMLLRKAAVSPAVIKAMLDKGIFEEVELEVSRILKSDTRKAEKSMLTSPQLEALDSTLKQLQQKEVVLLHGVTGSGKTEIYLELMESIVREGKQVLYLLPEIALTAQIIHRLKERFGAIAGVYHSKFNHSERIEIWQAVKEKKYQVILGARSALLLPFADLGLVIVDEEHDYSFKQQDPAPRYHARDTAIYLARSAGAKTILGTATPSVESYFNARSGKYGYVELTERYAGMQMPDTQLVDMKQRNGKKKELHFTNDLLENIQRAKEQHQQVILFQNRRGYSPYIVCSQCGWSPQCVNCDVHMVYHKAKDELRCHYCGFRQDTYHECPACSSTQLLIQGFGTEKVEDELQLQFPDLKIARLDMDAVKTKTGHERIIQDFEEGLVDVLVGTQMVTKGLDFDNVSLVGILSADQLLNFPDFRASERGYQLMMQVSGRAGRKHRQGKVLIQATNTRHPVLQYIIQHDRHAFYAEELEQRKKFLYPPFVRLIQITLKHKFQDRSLNAGYAFVQALGRIAGCEILGPVTPGIARIRGKYRSEILIKATTGALKTIKQKIRSSRKSTLSIKQFQSVEIVVDVDPV